MNDSPLRSSLPRLASLFLLVSATGAGAACSSDSDPPLYDGGRSTGGKAPADEGVSSGGMGGGENPQAMGGADGDGDAVGNGDSSPFDNLGGAATGPDGADEAAPLCATNVTWELESALDELNSPSEETLLTVTPDELTLVLLRDGAPYLSERVATASAWGAPVELELPDDFDVTRGVALSRDGLSLIAVQSDGAGFGLFLRSERGSTFDDEADEKPFSVVNSLAQMTSMRISHPVLSAESELWWVETWEDTAIHRSVFDPDEHITRTHVGCTKRGACDLLLDGIDGVGRFLTGISADHRTVLLEDENDGPLMLWRESVHEGYGFLTSVSLGARGTPQVNESCSRLYYSLNGDLFVDVAIVP